MKSITQVVEDLIKPYIDSHDRAAEAIIAPVETDATSASDDYAVGKQLILNNVLYDVIAPITTGDALVVNTNIKASDNVSSDIEALTKEITDAYALMSRNGAKNHVHVTATSQTINGVTFTVNDDGSIKANGTATEFTAFDIETTATGLKAVSGNYLLSDGLANPSASHYTTITVVDKNDVTTYDYANTKDAGKQAFSIVAEDIKSIYLAVCIGANVTVNDLVFYPMVRDAEDIDSDFQPYAKTNRELTAENQTLTNDTYNVNDTAITEVASDDLLPIYDTSATGKKKIAVSNFIGGLVSNPNLLDNPWFTVNQRGVTSFSDYPTNYRIVDRWSWKHFNGADATTKSLSVTNNGLVLSHDSAGKDAIRESLEDVVYKKFKNGELYTFSLLVSGSATIGLDVYDGSNWHRMKQDDITVSNANYQLVTATFEMWDTSNDTTFNIAVEFGNSPSITVHAAKLEKGSVSTLAQDTAPNYATELLKCQRYFYKTKGNATSSTIILTSYISRAGNNDYLIGFPFPVEMRTAPQVTNISAKDFFNINPTIDSGISAGSTEQGISFFRKDGAFETGLDYYMSFEASADL